MNPPHLCPHCGLDARPLAYHEGSGDCQVAMRAFTTRLREVLPVFTTYKEPLYQELMNKIGIGPDFEGVDICSDPSGKALIYTRKRTTSPTS